jgi:hypothetical protein
MTSKANTANLVLLAVATIAAVGLLLPSPIDSGGVMTWVRVTVPVILAGGTVHQASQARQRGEHAAADAFLGWGIVAVALVALLASGLGG